MGLDIISVSDHPISALLRGLVLVFIAHRSHKFKSLTPLGILAALITGFVHSLPPSNLYVILLIAFYLTSSHATKFRQDIKQKKTTIPKSADKVSESHSQRTHVQVLSNSVIATVLILISLFSKDFEIYRLLKAGIIGQYVSVTADTWSSELGILSTSSPILITTFQKVPPGTNGGVTAVGLLSGLAGSALISGIAAWTYETKQIQHFIYFSLIGLLGTVIDSILGAVLQYSLINKEGLVLEPIGGGKIDKAVLFEEQHNLKKVSGVDMLSNNQVNLLTALFTTLISIGLYEFFF